MKTVTTSRISEMFREKRSAGNKAFVAYITAGDPSAEMTESLVLALERGGADLIELGVPFSDPIADGPVIQRASERALKAGMNIPRLLDVVRRIRRQSEIPIVLFSYLNPLLRYGFDRLAQEAAGAGVDGVLLTDLCVEEAADPVAKLNCHGLDTVFLAAPTSTEARLERIAHCSSGFVYLVSRTGVTGEQQTIADSVRALSKRMRMHTDLPLAVGFGISTPAQVSEMAQVADAVVVGSALVKTIEQGGVGTDLAKTVQKFTRSLTAPLLVS